MKRERYKLNVTLSLSFAARHLRSRGHDIDVESGQAADERVRRGAGNLRRLLVDAALSDASRWNLVRFNPDNVLPACITRQMTGRDRDAPGGEMSRKRGVEG